MPLEDPQRFLTGVANAIQEIDVPPTLAESTRRHQANLLNLAQSLVAAGVDETTIEMSIEMAFEEYKQELLRTIHALRSEVRHD